MTTSRTLLRTVLPPVLALGLAALMVHPLDAVAPAAAAPAARTASVVLAEVAPAPANPSGVVVSVPAVAFQREASSINGAVRTAVLLTAPHLTATAQIVGIPGCRVFVASGTPTWLECVDPHADTISVRVTLSDGRVFAETDVPVSRL